MTLAELKSIKAEIHHTRQGNGLWSKIIWVYRLDPASPSSFSLIGGIEDSVEVQAELRGGHAPLSPTEKV